VARRSPQFPPSKSVPAFSSCMESNPSGVETSFTWDKASARSSGVEPSGPTKCDRARVSPGHLPAKLEATSTPRVEKQAA
jgi:hypothetical protein